ncbi:MAG: hypothetical protein RIG62_06325 [Cyclobacteriaceae bacterium]
MAASPQETDHSRWVNELLGKEPLLREKVQATQPSDGPEARVLLREALRFLHLIAFYNRKLTPSLPVDLTWHEFILFTRLYAAFCQEHFGRFIHHHPGGKEQENQRNFQKTIQLYNLHWGPPEARIWGAEAARLCEEAPCGSCLGTSQEP